MTVELTRKNRRCFISLDCVKYLTHSKRADASASTHNCNNLDDFHCDVVLTKSRVFSSRFYSHDQSGINPKNVRSHQTARKRSAK